MKIERGYPTYTVTPKAENAIVRTFTAATEPVRFTFF